MLSVVDSVPESLPDFGDLAFSPQYRSNLTLYLIVSLGAVSFTFLVAIIVLATIKGLKDRDSCCGFHSKDSESDVIKKSNLNIHISPGSKGPAHCVEVNGNNPIGQNYCYKMCLTPESSKSDFMFLKPCSPTGTSSRNNIKEMEKKTLTWSPASHSLGTRNGTTSPNELKQGNKDRTLTKNQLNYTYKSHTPINTGRTLQRRLIQDTDNYAYTSVPQYWTWGNHMHARDNGDPPRSATVTIKISTVEQVVTRFTETTEVPIEYDLFTDLNLYLLIGLGSVLFLLLITILVIIVLKCQEPKPSQAAPQGRNSIISQRNSSTIADSTLISSDAYWYSLFLAETRKGKVVVRQPLPNGAGFIVSSIPGSAALTETSASRSQAVIYRDLDMLTDGLQPSTPGSLSMRQIDLLFYCSSGFQSIQDCEGSRRSNLQLTFWISRPTLCERDIQRESNIHLGWLEEYMFSLFCLGEKLETIKDHASVTS
ncbi:hypothetical protein Q8A67_023792 [Cirrhinus molitorella]|uniref:Cadherin cytoplasmic C-terminal domain-containing protein n=1 Tax=Cirrhinus molitorella TaxID=172907 RepID=A0AA88TAI8_9TELE|nr:hypothetical protein Q8A67_023792 [Cirrhinus molitorella]